MRSSLASTLRVIGQTAGILAAVAWAWICWRFFSGLDPNATAQENRADFRLLCLAVLSVPLLGALVYWPFAALADRIARSERESLSGPDADNASTPVDARSGPSKK
jgi:hypothetical protein